jgi:hypothetical protein
MLLFWKFLRRFFIHFKHLFFWSIQWQCILSYDNSSAMYKFLKTLHPGGIRILDLLFWRRTRWPLCHAARALFLKGCPGRARELTWVLGILFCVYFPFTLPLSNSGFPI